MSDNWLEKAIEEAAARGDFDDLPGAGRRIEGLGGTYDPAWWAKGFVSREKAGEAGIELVAEIDRTLPVLLATAPLDDVLARVDRWNAAIDRINAQLDRPSALHPVDRDETERRWAALRS